MRGTHWGRYRQVVPLGPSQVITCPVVPAPIRGRGSGAFSKRKPGRKESQGGESFSPPWTHLSLVGTRREVGFSFSYNLRTDARNGPPPGWAGWGKWGGYREERGCGVPLPKAFPLGGRWPGAAGTDEGATGYPTEQKKTGVQAAGPVGHWFSTRKGFGVIAPSSVCFADSFPPRGSRWTWQVNRPYPICTKRLPQPAQLGGGPLPCVGCRAAGRSTKKAGYPEGYPKPEWGVQRGETLPSGVLSSISHRRNGGRRQAPPRGAAPRGRFGGTARRVRTHGGRAPRPHVAGYNLRWFQRYGLPPPTGGLTPPARRSGGPCWPASARRRRSTPRRRGSPG